MTNGVVDPETNDDWALVADGTVCGAPDSRSVRQKLFIFPMTLIDGFTAFSFPSNC